MAKCKKVFIAWSRLSSRTKRYARILKLKIFFIRDRPPYLRCMFYTLRKLLRERNDIVFVQLAPGPLLMLASILKYIRGYILIADMHSFFVRPSSAGGAIINKPFVYFLRFCDMIMVHSGAVKNMLPRKIKRKTIVVYDPPIDIGRVKLQPKKEEFTIVFPASFAKDEPIENIIMAVKRLLQRGMNIKLLITGRYERRRELLKYSDGKNIVFTGFLPTEKYYELLKSCDIIAALTKVSYSLMAVALEAMSIGKPLLLSDKPVFKKFFNKGVIYTDNSIDDLEKKIEMAYKNSSQLEKLSKEMMQVRMRYYATFRAITRKLLELLENLCKKRKN